MDKNEKQRIYRQKTGNSVTKKYEKTKRGLIMRMYRNMKSMVSGVQKKKSHLYFGKELLDKNVFYQLAESDINFHKIYNNWVVSNYQRKLSPSVDRINSNLGYTIDNIHFITHSENSRKASINRHHGHPQMV